MVCMCDKQSQHVLVCTSAHKPTMPLPIINAYTYFSISPCRLWAGRRKRNPAPPRPPPSPRPPQVHPSTQNQAFLLHWEAPRLKAAAPAVEGGVGNPSHSTTHNNSNNNSSSSSNSNNNNSSSMPLPFRNTPPLAMQCSALRPHALAHGRSGCVPPQHTPKTRATSLAAGCSPQARGAMQGLAACLR